MKQNLNFLRHFISNNVNPPEKGFVSKFWPREMKIAKSLLIDFPDQEFWANFKIEFPAGKDGKPKKMNSLAYLKMKDGDALLRRKYAEYHFKPVVKTDSVLEISDGKFGETLYNHKPQKFVRDFLN